MKPAYRQWTVWTLCALALQTASFPRPTPEFSRPEPLASIQTAMGGVPSLSKAGDLVAFSSTGRVEVRRAETGELIAELPAAHQVVFTPSGRYLALGMARRIELYLLGSWREPAVVVEFEGQGPGAFTTTFAVSPDDRSFWVGIRDQTPSSFEAWLSRCSVPEETADIPCQASPARGILTPSTVWALEFSPDGAKLAVSHGLAIELRDALSGRLLSEPLSAKRPEEFAQNTTALTFSPDGSLLAGSRYSDAPLIWDLRTKSLRELRWRRAWLPHSSSGGRKAGFSADGRYFFGVDGQRLWVWRTDDWKPARVLAEEGSAIDGFTISGDGRIAALRLTKVDVRGRPTTTIMTVLTDDLVAFTN